MTVVVIFSGTAEYEVLGSLWILSTSRRDCVALDSNLWTSIMLISISGTETCSQTGGIHQNNSLLEVTLYTCTSKSTWLHLLCISLEAKISEMDIWKAGQIKLSAWQDITRGKLENIFCYFVWIDPWSWVCLVQNNLIDNQNLSFQL